MGARPGSHDGAESARRALAALRVLRDRTRAAVTALEAKNFAQCERLLNLKTAAFHNFRALDHVAQADGADLGKDRAARVLWGEIEALDLALKTGLEAAREVVRGESAKAAEVRRALGRFRSQDAKTGFIGTA